VGISPTFVVGLYGMNFKTMPEYDWAWGYGWGWAMIVVSVVVPLVWLRVKGWL
jgi:magnesium transporter